MNADYFELKILFFFCSVHYHYGELRKVVTNICRETQLFSQRPNLAAKVREIDRQLRDLRLSWYADERETILDTPNLPSALTSYQNEYGYINNEGASVLPMNLLGTLAQKQQAVKYWHEIMNALYLETD